MIRAGIVGSRTWRNKEVFDPFMNFLRERGHSFVLVSGGCPNSPDDYAEKAYKKYFETKPLIYEAEWGTHGSSAPFVRNTLIARDSEILLCFYDPSSKTKGCIDTVIKFGDHPLFIMTPAITSGSKNKINYLSLNLAPEEGVKDQLFLNFQKDIEDFFDRVYPESLL